MSPDAEALGGHHTELHRWVRNPVAVLRVRTEMDHVGALDGTQRPGEHGDRRSFGVSEDQNRLAVALDLEDSESGISEAAGSLAVPGLEALHIAGAVVAGSQACRRASRPVQVSAVAVADEPETWGQLVRWGHWTGTVVFGMLHLVAIGRCCQSWASPRCELQYAKQWGQEPAVLEEKNCCCSELGLGVSQVLAIAERLVADSLTD